MGQAAHLTGSGQGRGVTHQPGIAPRRQAFRSGYRAFRVVGAFRQLVAQVQQHSRNVDFDGADLAAGPAEAGSLGQILGLAQADQGGGNDGADGAGIDPTVSMAANFAVNRADVKAGGATDAVQGLPQVRVGQQFRPAIVHQHQVKLLRAVLVGGAARAADHTDVAGQTLAGGGAGQQPQKQGQVLQRRDDLFHPGDADVDSGGRGAQAAVAFVGNDNQRSGLGHQEICAADSQVRLQKLVAQAGTGNAGHFLDVVGQGRAQLVVEQLSHLFLGLVQGRRNQMGRGFFSQLDDVLAQIGLVNVNSISFQGAVQVQFFRDHRLALGGDFNLPGVGDFGYYRVGLGRIASKMDLAAGLGNPVVQQFQVVVQVVQGVNLDPAGLFPPGIPNLLPHLFNSFQAGAAETAANLSQGAAQHLILHRCPGSGLELRRLYFSHGARPPAGCPEPGRCAGRQRNYPGG